MMKENSYPKLLKVLKWNTQLLHSKIITSSEKIAIGNSNSNFAEFGIAEQEIKPFHLMIVFNFEKREISLLPMDKEVKLNLKNSSTNEEFIITQKHDLDLRFEYEILISENIMIKLNDDFLTCQKCKNIITKINQAYCDQEKVVCLKCYDETNFPQNVKLTDKILSLQKEVQMTTENHLKLKKGILKQYSKEINEITALIKNEMNNRMEKDFNTLFNFQLMDKLNVDLTNSDFLDKSVLSEIKDQEEKIKKINNQIKTFADKNFLQLKDNQEIIIEDNISNISRDDIKEKMNNSAKSVANELIKLLIAIQSDNHDNENAGNIEEEINLENLIKNENFNKMKILPINNIVNVNNIVDESLLDNFENLKIIDKHFPQKSLNQSSLKRNKQEHQISYKLKKEDSVTVMNNSECYNQVQGKHQNFIQNASMIKMQKSILNKTSFNNQYNIREFGGDDNIIYLYAIPAFIGTEKEVYSVLKQVFYGAGVINVIKDRKDSSSFLVKIFVDCDKISDYYDNIDDVTEIIIKDCLILVEKDLVSKSYPILYASKYMLIHNQQEVKKKIEVIDLTY